MNGFAGLYLEQAGTGIGCDCGWYKALDYENYGDETAHRLIQCVNLSMQSYVVDQATDGNGAGVC